MKGNGKKVFKFILTGGGCFADPDVIKHKIKEIKEKRASKDKKPTIREIKNARGIRVITVESHNYWDDYTWDDDEETLCAPSYFIRGEPVPEPVPEPTPEPIARPASESIPAACPVETPDNEPEPCSDLRSFTSVPALELASRNPGLYRHQLDEQENNIFRNLNGPDLFLSPLENPGRILCTGPGTVSWAIEVAEMFPQAEVLCLDPNPYPRLMPRNCHVESYDIRNYSPQSGWDFVYIRCTRSAIYWPRILERSQAVTRIGGWVEMVDLERENAPICTCRSVVDCIPDFHCAICESFPAIDAREVWMAEVGFEDVKQVIRRGKSKDENPYQVESVTLHGKLVSRPPHTPSQHSSTIDV